MPCSASPPLDIYWRIYKEHSSKGGMVAMARILISVPDDRLRKVDALARARGKSRSAFLVESALAADDRRRTVRPADEPSVRHALRVMEATRERWKPGADSVLAVRAMRDHGRH